jgi:hypothetical protein
MLTEIQASIIDNFLAGIPCLLSQAGLTFKQKVGYKAGKLSRTRNWCQIVDGDLQIPICFPNTRGELKMWKLFARFDSTQPPSWPWDKPERYERKKAQWMIAGDDVWGVSYEDIRDRPNKTTATDIIKHLSEDLQTSFAYSRQRYC